MSNKAYSKHRYTAAQKEILCNLDVGSNENAKKWQNKLAGKLADQIENDVENTLYNPEKINKYREKAGLPPIEAENPFINNENALTALSWFTSFRLFIVRINGALAAAGLGFLPKWFDILGLSYLAELVFDFADIGYTTFGPLRQREKELITYGQATRAQIYWWRFKNKLGQDEELIPRMLNAVVWFGLNLASFIMTGGFAGLATTAGHAVAAAAIKRVVTYMNIGGFIFDFVLEGIKGLKDYWQNSQTLVEVTKEIYDLTNKRKILSDGYTLVLMSTLPENNRKKAEPGKIYLADNGDYIVRGLNGKVHKGKIDTREINFQNLDTKLTNNNFKQKILEITNLFGHTQHTKRDLEDAGKTNSKEYKAVCERIAKTESKLESRKVFKTELEKKISWSIIPVRIYNWAMTGLVGVGMSFLAGIDKTLMLAGRCMSLTFGSVFNGLGKRLIYNKLLVPAYNKIKEAIFAPSLPTEIKEAQNNNISINSDATPQKITNDNHAINDNHVIKNNYVINDTHDRFPKTTKPMRIKNTRDITHVLQDEDEGYTDYHVPQIAKTASSPMGYNIPDDRAFSCPVQIPRINTRYNSSTSYPSSFKSGRDISSVPEMRADRPVNTKAIPIAVI